MALIGVLVACDARKQQIQQTLGHEPEPKVVFEIKKQTKSFEHTPDSVLFVFRVRNVGLSVWHLFDVQTSCGCTVSNYDSLLLPSDSSNISFVMEILPKDSTKTVHATLVSNASEKYHLLTMTYIRRSQLTEGIE